MTKQNTMFQPRTGLLRHPRTLLLSGLLATAGAGSGCDLFMQKPLCPELPACGNEGKGDAVAPFGQWILADKTTSASCAEDLYIPPTDTRLTMGEVPAARSPIPEPALFDWCLLLVTSGGKDIQARPPRFSLESAHVGAASVKFNQIPDPAADPNIPIDPNKPNMSLPMNRGNYSVGTTRTGNFSLDFPGYCMRAFGAMDGRQADPINDPMGPPVDVCKQLQVPLNNSGVGEGAYRNIRCDVSPTYPGGCLCKFDASAAGGGAGSFDMLSASTLRHLPNTNFPQKVKFCRQGDRLQLTGGDGEYLFDQPGLRTLDLVRAPTVMQ